MVSEPMTYGVLGQNELIYILKINKGLTVAEEHCHHSAEQSCQMLSRHCHFDVDCHVSCT